MASKSLLPQTACGQGSEGEWGLPPTPNSPILRLISWQRYLPIKLWFVNWNEQFSPKITPVIPDPCYPCSCGKPGQIIASNCQYPSHPTHTTLICMDCYQAYLAARNELSCYQPETPAFMVNLCISRIAYLRQRALTLAIKGLLPMDDPTCLPYNQQACLWCLCEHQDHDQCVDEIIW